MSIAASVYATQLRGHSDAETRTYWRIAVGDDEAPVCDGPSGPLSSWAVDTDEPYAWPPREPDADRPARPHPRRGDDVIGRRGAVARTRASMIARDPGPALNTPTNPVHASMLRPDTQLAAVGRGRSRQSKSRLCPAPLPTRELHVMTELDPVRGPANSPTTSRRSCATHSRSVVDPRGAGRATGGRARVTLLVLGYPVASCCSAATIVHRSDVRGRLRCDGRPPAGRTAARARLTYRAGPAEAGPVLSCGRLVSGASRSVACQRALWRQRGAYS